MSTIYAFRRKGFTADAINLFAEKIGVTRAPNMIPITLLEQCCRLDLDHKVISFLFYYHIYLY
jgi:glutaminyl-tRNA synthetase